MASSEFEGALPPSETSSPTVNNGETIRSVAPDEVVLGREFGRWGILDRLVENVAAGIITFDMPIFGVDRHKPIGQAEKEMLADLKQAIWRGEQRYLSDLGRKIITGEGHSVEVSGIENLPTGENFIAMANHYKGWFLSGMAIPLVQNHLVREARSREDIDEIVYLVGYGSDHFVFRRGLFRSKPFFEAIAQTVQGIPVDREHVREGNGSERKQLSSLVRARQVLANGGILGIMPEDKTSKALKRAKGEVGQFLIVVDRKLGLPVVPFRYWSEDGKKLHADIGKPVPVKSELYDSRSPEDGQKVVDEIMGRHIAPALPEKLRGYYR